MNSSVPQFRTPILIPGTESAVRLHFIHARSAHSNAVPLLLIPPFPFTNLSLGHLLLALTNPDDAASKQPFHVAIPSLPGLGFSDALPNNTRVISTTAKMFDVLMKRLGYKYYIASSTGPATSSPSDIDWKLANHLSQHFSRSCLGVGVISPPLGPPSMQESPVGWAKWKLVNLIGRPTLGYSQDDLSALRRIKAQTATGRKGHGSELFSDFRDPTILSYGLCDSPMGLLLFILVMLRKMGAEKDFSPQDIITLTELTWLPGPEATLRFWADCASSTAEESKHLTRKSRIGITLFTGDDETLSDELMALPRAVTNHYACPKWAETRYEVVSTSRVSGKPGFLAWERPEAIVDGVRGLAKAILALDKRLQQSEQVPLEHVVVVDEGGGGKAPDTSGATIQGATSSGLPKVSPVKKAGYFGIPAQQDKGWPMTPKTPERVLPLEEMAGSGTREEFEDTSPDTVINVGTR